MPGIHQMLKRFRTGRRKKAWPQEEPAALPSASEVPRFETIENMWCLFRGERSLPKGLPPYSGFLRRALRQGRSLEDAIQLNERFVFSMMIDEPHADIFWHSERATNENLLVSSTASLGRALAYATGYGSRPESGYVSVLILRPERCLKIDEFYAGGVSVLDAEVAICVLVEPWEIILQIDASDLQEIFSSREIEAVDRLRKIDQLPCDLFNEKFLFRPSSLELLCPNCGLPISPQFCEHLGTDTSKIKVLNDFAFKDGRSFRFTRGADPLMMTASGASTICNHCQLHLFNPEVASHELARLRPIKSGSRITSIEIENLADDPIAGFSLRLFNGGATTSVNCDLVEVVSMDLSDTIKRGDLVYDISIPPFSKRILSAPSEEFDRLELNRVDFESGRSWRPFDRFLED
jgi:hypothetical protein